MPTLYGIPNCGSVRRARAWLDAGGVAYAFHDYKKSGVERAMLERWADASEWEALLNRAGTTFRQLSNADKADIDRDKAIGLMLAQPSLINRPVVEGAGILLVGFKPDAYFAAFEPAAS